MDGDGDDDDGTGAGPEGDTEDVRSGGESDVGDTGRWHTACTPLGWTQRELDQQAALRRSRRSEREMRRGGTRQDDQASFRDKRIYTKSKYLYTKLVDLEAKRPNNLT